MELLLSFFTKTLLLSFDLLITIPFPSKKGMYIGFEKRTIAKPKKAIKNIDNSNHSVGMFGM